MVAVLIPCAGTAAEAAAAAAEVTATGGAAAEDGTVAGEVAVAPMVGLA